MLAAARAAIVARDAAATRDRRSILTTSTPPRLREFRPGDEAAVLDLFEAVFGKRRSLASWRWQFEQAPAGRAQIHLLEEDGELIGHFAHVPFEVSVDGRRLRLARGCDLMLRADRRRRGGMRALIERYLAAARDCDLQMSFPNVRSVELTQRYGGGRLIGWLPKWVRMLGPSPELGPAGALGGALGALAGRLVAPRAAPLPVTRLDPLDAAVDRLADASAGFAPCLRVRDAAYLRWRWREQPDSAWTITGVRAADELRGFAVLGVSVGDPRRGVVADLLAADPTALRSLLVDAVARLAAAGCRRVVCDLHDPRPWARRQLLRAGFLPMRGDLRVVCGALGSTDANRVERLAAWYLTRGDSDLA
ncbi:MAG: GNAT family N-acetyltransferase [Thermoanaerobaculia bacterium]|nr:GNAT family N-acetyltransferase [Thermoanaerobaculia bacterium]